MPFGLDLTSVIVGILLGWFALPYLWAMIMGLLAGGRKAPSTSGA